MYQLLAVTESLKQNLLNTNGPIMSQCWSGWLLYTANPLKPGEQEWLGDLSVMFDIFLNNNSIQM